MEQEKKKAGLVAGCVVLLTVLSGLSDIVGLPFRFLWLQVLLCVALIVYVWLSFGSIKRFLLILLILFTLVFSWIVTDDEIKAHILFSRAINYVENGEYENALNLFQSPTLSTYPSAILNIGYLYEKGQIGSDDGTGLEMALNYYNQVETAAAYRGKLSCYVQLQTSRQDLNTTWANEIYSNINTLVEMQDMATLDYLAACAYGRSYSELSDKEKDSLSNIDLGLLCAWEPNGYYEGYSAPGDNWATHYEFVKVDWDASEGVSHPYMVYQVYTIVNIDMLSVYQVSL